MSGRRGGRLAPLAFISLLAAALPAAPGCVAGGPRAAGGGGPASRAPEPFAGPIPYRSMMPLSVIFPQPPPEPASVLAAGGVELEANADYATIYVSDATGGESILVDGEFLRTGFTCRVGLGRILGAPVEAGAEIPLLHDTSGFLDHFIEDWHDFFGMSQGKRDQTPHNQFGASYTDASGQFFSAEEDGLHLGDIPLWLKVGLVDPAEDHGFGLALRGLLELPTGNESDGFGSGQLDGGIGALAEKRFGRLAVYVSVDEIFRRNPDSFRDLHVAHVTHAAAAAEYALSRVVALIVQTDFQTVPMKGADLDQLDDPQWMAGLGAAFRLTERSLLRIAFEEGLTTEAAPDFTLSAGYVIRF